MSATDGTVLTAKSLRVDSLDGLAAQAARGDVPLGAREGLRKGVDIAGNASDFRHRDGTTKRYLAYRLARERPDLHSEREYQDGRD
jgi:hypothetical protein